MISNLLKLRDLLDRREQRQALLLLGVMLVMGVVEMVGVASILPLIAVLADPGIVKANPYFRAVYEYLSLPDINAFLIFLSASMFAVVVGRIAFAALTQYALVRYAHMRAHALSVRLLGIYLRRPYAWYLNRHSADLGKTVLSEVDQVIKGSLIPALQLASHLIVAASIITLIVLVDPIVALTASTAVASAYGIVYAGISRFLFHIGQERVQSNRQRYQIAQEVLGGVKEVKVGGLERGYLRRFERASLRLARRTATSQVVRELPRHALEALAAGGMLIVIIVLLLRADGKLAAALPGIALYAFAALRLLPVLQSIFRELVSLRFGQPALDALHNDLTEKVDGPDIGDSGPPIRLAHAISLDGVSFTYPNADRPALSGVTLTIPAHAVVGVVGSTGAGKSTLIDIVLGLLTPQDGTLKVDGVVIGPHNVRAWQRSVGYVPQQIFLADESVAANIAFGLPPNQIDEKAVERAARMANLHDFIVEELPQGYDTRVGERGVRLSGGQRQRIGIARALYHDPDVLVLDEATSALDNLTERTVMDAVRDLSSRKTIIMIAHRLTTVKECDTIFFLERGKIQAVGPYDELLGSTAQFKKLAMAH